MELSGKRTKTGQFYIEYVSLSNPFVYSFSQLKTNKQNQLNAYSDMSLWITPDHITNANGIILR